jgi:7-cyano-7-deazaguanine synthase
VSKILKKKAAVLLLSGGLDSCTTLAIMVKQGFIPFCLSFSYGQKNNVELDCAKKVATHYNVAHQIITINLKIFGNSSLTTNVEVSKDRVKSDIQKTLPNTYVPARNTIFLSYALAFAEINNAFDIFIGANVLDYSGYPDCRPEYISAFSKMANLALVKTTASSHKITIHTPLIQLTKKEIIQKGISLGVNYGLSSSCYDPKNDRACGRCDACFFRLEGFKKIGISDPIKYDLKI